MPVRLTLRLALPVLLILAAPGSRSVGAVKADGLGFSAERLHRVHELIERTVAAGDFSGAVTLIARNGRIARLEAQGLMNIESKKPMTTDSIFRIASMTKPLVAVGILILVEQGKVHLADRVSQFIPEYKQLKVATSSPSLTAPAEREITVRDLLTHTSGLVSGPISSREVPVKEKDTLADYVPRLAVLPLEFQPGTRWAYSGLAGFDALLRIAEVASGMPADRFLKSHVFDPLGMKDTFFYPLEGNPRLVTLYRKTVNGLEREQNPSRWNGVYFDGGGGLMSTAEDYFKFAQMLLNDGELQGTRLLAPRTVEIMRSPVVPETLPGRVPGEGFGLSVRVITNPLARNTFLSAGSFGWSGGFGTHFWVDPKERVIGILMAQTDTTQVRPALETAVMQAIVEPARQLCFANC
jgi:CubicO group peptidase (beta-lactamase class C family)